MEPLSLSNDLVKRECDEWKSASYSILQGIWKACIGILVWICVLELLLATARRASNTHLRGVLSIVEFWRCREYQNFGSDAVVTVISVLFPSRRWLYRAYEVIWMYNLPVELLRTRSKWWVLAPEKRARNVGAWEAQDAISYKGASKLLNNYIFIIEDWNLMCNTLTIFVLLLWAWHLFSILWE
jgi:hypothetical protein